MEFLKPKTLGEAVEFLAKHPTYNILAGGTDLCVQMNSGLLKPEGIVSIWNLDELKGVSEDGDFITVGVLATHTEIASNGLVKKFVPALVDACRSVGARQIQNRGTIGGNVMNASPAGDTLPVLMAYETSAVVLGTGGPREIKFTDFYRGYRETAVGKGEIVARFKIRKAVPGERAAFSKIGARKAQAISKVMGCFRILLDRSGCVRAVALALGSVAAVPVRLYDTEKFLVGKTLTKDDVAAALNVARGEVSPIDDIRSTAIYRRHALGVMLERFLKN